MLDTRSAGRPSLYSGSVIRGRGGSGEEKVDGSEVGYAVAVEELSVEVVVKGVE